MTETNDPVREELWVTFQRHWTEIEAGASTADLERWMLTLTWADVDWLQERAAQMERVSRLQNRCRDILIQLSHEMGAVRSDTIGVTVDRAVAIGDPVACFLAVPLRGQPVYAWCCTYWGGESDCVVTEILRRWPSLDTYAAFLEEAVDHCYAAKSEERRRACRALEENPNTIVPSPTRH